MLIADEIKARGVEIDTERVLRMSLVHDWAETRVGDLPKTATHYFGAQVRSEAETAAFEDMVAGMSAEQSLTTIHDDYERRDSVEARVVKAADILDLLIQAYALERSGARGLDEFWEVATKINFQLPAEANEVIDDLLQLILAERQRLRGSAN